MRTWLAAGFAAAVVIVAVALGWQAVSQRLQPDETGPGDVFDALAAAIEAGPDGEVATTVRTGGTALGDAIDSFASVLTVDSWQVEHGAIAVDGARASTELRLTVMTEEVGEITWEHRVEATRIRGEWGIDATAATLHPELGENRRLVVRRSDVTRAPILDRDGDPLTSRGAARSIGVSPAQIVNRERLLETWAALLPRSFEDLQELLARDDLHPEWFYPLVTITEEQYEQVWTRLRSVPGVISRDAEDATPTAGDFATHVLGRVGRPTAEQVEELGVPADAVIGLRGLERVFEDRLVGSRRVRVVIVDGDGDRVAVLAGSQQDPSGPVATTLDRTVQQAVFNALVGVSEHVAVVVVDAADGAIRASASRPLSGYNRAWEGNYPPGDAFLPVAAEALLAGDVALRDAATCPPDDAVVGAQFIAPRPLGQATVGQALAAGCDTTLAALAADLDEGALVEAAGRFGFGVAYELPLDAATAQVPGPRDPTERVRAAAGQARVLASPLHMATVVAAASTGTWHAPYLLRDTPADRPSAELSVTAVEDVQRLLALGGEGGGSAAGFSALGAGGFVGTAPVTGGDMVHAWAVGVVDGLAFAVLVEDTGGDPAPARRIADRFLRELQALTR